MTSIFKSRRKRKRDLRRKQEATAGPVRPSPRPNPWGIEGLSRSEVSLIRLAVRNRWPVPSVRRPQLVSLLLDCVVSAESDARSAISASMVLIEMDMANVASEAAGEGDAE